MKHRIHSQLRSVLRAALTALCAGSAVAGATDFDLSLTKTADVSSLAAGGAVNFTIKVANAGPYAASNVVIGDMLPKGFRFVGATPTPNRTDANSDPKIVKYFFNLGTINAKSSKTISLRATGVAPGAISGPHIDDHFDYKNIAQVYSVDNSGYDPDSTPNDCNYASIAAGKKTQDDCAYVRVPVTEVARPSLTLSKTGNGPWTAGQSGASYTLTVGNTSSVTTNGPITVVDQLPDGVSPVSSTSAPANGWTCTTSGQTVTCTTTSSMISGGGSVSLNLPVSVSASAASTITNRAVVSGGGDPDAAPTVATCTPGSSSPSNQCATYATTVSVPSTPPVVCSNLYALVITNTVNNSYGTPLVYNGGKIQRLNETTNTLTGPSINLPGGAYSASLAVAPDGSKFYVADDNDTLRIYTASTGVWSRGGTFSGVSDRLVRMATTPNGTGYAMDASGNVWSFTAGGSVSALGRFTSTSASAPSFYQNGDFFSTQDGKLYLLSAQTGGNVSLWYVNPATRTAEYLGDLTDAARGVQYNGLAATPNGIYAATSAGQLGKVDPVNVSISPVGGATIGSTDLASCTYPAYAPKVGAVKSVAKVAGSSGDAVRPGDTLEYTITVRNSGNLPAGGATFRDALPAGTTYVADSARINGFASTTTAGRSTSLGGASYPFGSAVGICSKDSGACTAQVLKPDTTPGTLDHEAVVTFRVTVDDGVSSVKNSAVVNYNDGNTPPTDIPTNETTTPVTPLPQLAIVKTSNATDGTWTVGQSGAVYTLTVTNTSTVPTAGTITVKDLLPSGITLRPAALTPASGWTCTVSGQVATCTTSNVIAAGAGVALAFPVDLSAAAIGSVTNKASVGGGGDPDPLPDPATCEPTVPSLTKTVGAGTGTAQNQCASVTVTITGSTAPAVCTNLYGLMLDPAASAYPANGRTIQQISDSTNALGTVVATLPGGQTSATLGVSPDGKKFFVAADASGTTSDLLVYDTASGRWITGGSFALSSSSARLVRMTVAADGTGYAMDSASRLYSFSTTAPYATTVLGRLTSASSGAPSFADNGDMFASSQGLYMLSSVTGSPNIDLWLINPATRSAEYLGRVNDVGQTNSQYNGFAVTPNGVFGRDNYGRLVKINLTTVTLQQVGSPTLGSSDLASCSFPTYAPSLGVTKTVKKVAGSDGSAVYPGDTLEYTITVRNSGNLPAGGATFSDALPEGTTYVADSARINGAASTTTANAPTSLSGAAYPFASAVGICSAGPSGSAAGCTTQVLKMDTTPNTLDNEAVITFRVRVVDPFTLNPSQVSNQAIVKYTDGPNGGVPSDDPTTPAPNDPTVTPVVKPVKLVAVKTVQNITAGSEVSTQSSGKPGDVLEYCIRTSNQGSAYASNIRFGDTVPGNTTFLVGAYGAGKDIHVTTSAGLDTYYTSAADSDAGVLDSGRVTVSGGSLVLQPQQSFTVCFRATIQ